MYREMSGQRLDGQDKSASSSTIHGCHRALRTALEQAADKGIIKINTAIRAKPPRPPKYRPRILTEREIDTLLEAAHWHRLYALFVTALHTRLRMGECLGLRWEDIDWRNSKAHIQRALQDVHRRPLYPGKQTSEDSTRDVLLPAIVINALRGHKARQSASVWQVESA